ncbi:hypothetical protein TNCV_2499101 [Trichonephila clavipes]|nr:hypothetical protein TNCV_2499101 [Trichonephila clavipes]
MDIRQHLELQGQYAWQPLKMPPLTLQHRKNITRCWSGISLFYQTNPDSACSIMMNILVSGSTKNNALLAFNIIIWALHLISYQTKTFGQGLSRESATIAVQLPHFMKCGIDFEVAWEDHAVPVLHAHFDSTYNRIRAVLLFSIISYVC